MDAQRIQGPWPGQRRGFNSHRLAIGPAEVIEARIPDLQRRLEFFEEPVKFKEESLVTLGAALDVVEKRLSEEEGGGPFICGEDYTLADVCFTCTIARYGRGRSLISDKKLRFNAKHSLHRDYM